MTHPTCGAVLPDSTVFFCPECSKLLPENTPNTLASDKSAKEKKSRKRPHKEKSVPEKCPKTEPLTEDDYDGYYDDRKCFFCIFYQDLQSMAS